MSDINRNWLLSGVLFSLLWANAASALTIDPVLIELTPTRRVASITVSNPSDHSKNLQAEVLSWQQNKGVDQYTETDTLFVIPAIAEIAPGGTQVFRVSSRSPVPSTVEQAYRLILEEIPDESGLTQTGSMINLLYRFSLPLFVSPSEAVQSDLRWSLCAAPANKGCIQLDNRGNRRIRLSKLTVSGDGWQQAVPDGATVLAGSVKQWTLDMSAGQRLPKRVSAKSELGDISADLSAPTP
ncbi:MAG: fimbria/pilus periplasmic chaperone [Methylobacter sp.]